MVNVIPIQLSSLPKILRYETACFGAAISGTRSYRYTLDGHLCCKTHTSVHRVLLVSFSAINLMCSRSPADVDTVDDTAEIEIWMPHGLTTANYPPRQAHSISCFIHMCGLAEILNQVLIHFYSPTCDLSSSSALACALEQSSKMRVWWKDLPEHLKINVGVLPRLAPPSHIVTLKWVACTL